jgi:hypothetical protein
LHAWQCHTQVTALYKVAVRAEVKVSLCMQSRRTREWRYVPSSTHF